MDTGKSPELSLADLLERVETSAIASIKGTVSGILSIISDPAASSSDLIQLIEVDPPLAAKILRVANSSYYATSRTISDIHQALIWVGFDTLKEIILTQKMSELFHDGMSVCGYSHLHLWRHSLAVALLAKTIYRREFGEKGNNAYAAGLMHDIGVIVEDQLLHREFISMVQAMEKSPQALTEAELSLFGYDHGRVGRALAEKWNFPAELIEGIGFHHNPEGASEKHCLFTKTIFIADYLMFEQGYGYVRMPLPDREILQQYVRDLGLQWYALRLIVELVREELGQIEQKGYLAV
ncbi:HDOD domain-containing protein [Thiovibrio frasassiensis]|jgi:putative nucleotidyltransferase with HDIG domain|uniref:HDOD domain-containing protein n=1 Tax=Thiovibrio frasassiensis TaxID=2984131 RepID=A0A9X4MHV5_9BACT|nr:HDOD domain-containing protein [Thiovibrio frasassiensis]MDG4476907.1 HDOD domain-containing protein [Thiovibrio frasassiensis]